MKGFIKMETAEYEGHTGVQVETKLNDVSLADRVQFLDCLCRVLHIDNETLGLFASMKKLGIMDDLLETKVVEEEEKKSESATDLFKQLLDMLFDKGES